MQSSALWEMTDIRVCEQQASLSALSRVLDFVIHLSGSLFSAKEKQRFLSLILLHALNPAEQAGRVGGLLSVCSGVECPENQTCLL